MMTPTTASLLILSLCVVVFGQDKSASCEIKEDSGIAAQNIKGTITFTQPAGQRAVTIQINLDGFDTTDNLDTHGFHVHAEGNLGNNCGDAGGHYNPDNVDHGAPFDSVRHVGDLGNVNETAGKVETSIQDSIISLRDTDGTKNIIGKAIVVHATFDDLGRVNNNGSRTTGNAGARLGCCVIEDTTGSAVTITISATALLLTVIVSLLNL